MDSADTTTTPRSKHRRSRWRAIFKWSGLAACILIAALFAVSIRWRIARDTPSQISGKPAMCGIVLSDGAVSMYNSTARSFLAGPFPRWSVEQCSDDPLVSGSFPEASRDEVAARLSLWIPFVLFAVPTSLLFCTDHRAARRARAGVCVKCCCRRAGLSHDAPCIRCGHAAPALYSHASAIRRPRDRWVAILRWSGLAACVVLVALWAVSRRWSITREQRYLDSGRPAVRTIALSSGHLDFYDVWTVYATDGMPPHWSATSPPAWPTYWRPHWDTDDNRLVVALPLWIPLVMLGVPTARRFYTDYRFARRAKSGQCIACGYSRAGIAPESPCPECGRLPASAKTPTT